MESFNPVQPSLGESVPQTAVRYEYSSEFPGILEHLRASLAISTYQAGQLVLVGVSGGKLEFSFHGFRQPMGIAVSPDCIAVGSHRELHLLRGSHDIARRIAPAGTYDSAWIARSSIITGAIQSHEMAWGRRGFTISTHSSRASAPSTTAIASIQFGSPRSFPFSNPTTDVI